MVKALDTKTYDTPRFQCEQCPVSRVDFFVNTTLNWAVELVREGSPSVIEEHLHRFTSQGKYSHLHAKEWYVVDFRRHDQEPTIFRYHLVTVRLSEDFSFADVYFGKSGTYRLKLEGLQIRPDETSR